MLRRLGGVLRTGRLSRFEHPEVHRQEQQDGDKVDHKGAVPAQGGQIAGAGQHQHRQRRANHSLHRQPEAALFVVKVIDQHGVSDGQHHRLRQPDAEAAAKDAGQGGDVQRHSAADAIQQRGAEQQFTAAKFIRQPAGAGPGDGDHQTGRGEHQRHQGFDIRHPGEVLDQRRDRRRQGNDRQDGQKGGQGDDDALDRAGLWRVGRIQAMAHDVLLLSRGSPVVGGGAVF